MDVEATQGAQCIIEGKEHVNSVLQWAKIVDLPLLQPQALSVEAVNMKERTPERIVGQMADVPVIPQERIRQCTLSQSLRVRPLRIFRNRSMRWSRRFPRSESWHAL